MKRLRVKRRSPVLLAIPATAAIATAAYVIRRQNTTSNKFERLGAAALETLLNAIDANDPVTGAHVRRVARYAMVLAEAMEVNEHTMRTIERVALFHDIGKIHEALFDIVHDHDALTPEEREAVATHPQRGADVLAPLAGFYPELAAGVLAHHERWDGTGYPRRLRGADIPLEARIVAIADTFDAVTHSRRYRTGASSGRGVDVIAEGRATQFDPSFVDLFLSPDVIRHVEREMQAEPPKQRSENTERRTREASDAPDIQFRWHDTQVPAVD